MVPRVRRPRRVVPPTSGVGGRQHGAARVEHGGDARFGDRDGLLLHGFVDRDAVLGPHLVKLVDAHHPPVRQHHGPALQVELAPRVLDDGGGQPGGGGALARGNASRRLAGSRHLATIFRW